ncbi:hypothetical protein BT63DRAFT_478981 [Microthyrium microscopicum]|uniref:Uncharacterized protein n=1 Tax=Microthyrium microscopicum TaxID=703497 RepID=A0A6A6UA20_9PEZI|nr:hypothetical protein BT63DRAFT_478981 [Microthyrium microscopicum]
MWSNTIFTCVITVFAITGQSLVASGKGREIIGLNDEPSPIDPLYTKPHIDKDEWRDKPVRHRYVHGIFNGTDLRFSFYLPPKEIYKGRFFQPVSAISGSENVVFATFVVGVDLPDMGLFGFDSGAAMVESNQGRLDPLPGSDPTIPGYRGSAATARFAREVMQKMYGPHRTYGYVYGGSGGAYKAQACSESTSGIWDGSVPFIAASPVAIPNVFTVLMHAMRIIGDDYEKIVDAADVGGSGDIYAGLNTEKKEALQEVTRFGLAPAAWFRYTRSYLSYAAVFSQLLDNVYRMDPTYFDDFWTKPGYLGSNATQSLLKARVSHKTTIKAMLTAKQVQALGIDFPVPENVKNVTDNAPLALWLSDAPSTDLTGSVIKLETGAAAGKWVYTLFMVGPIALITYGERNSPSLGLMKAGDSVIIDNSIFLASQTYHRHQDPGPEYPVWEQFRKDGKPIYPQRPLLSQRYDELSGTGTTQNGKINTKMILVESQMDEIALPWESRWYENQVRKHLGADMDKHYRTWMIDKSMHTPPDRMIPTMYPAENTRIVSYIPVIQQALRDLVQWVENGVPAPASTNYTVVDGNIQLPDSAAQRLGIQPVVTLKANGKERADVKVGESVEFSGVIELPPGIGKIISAELDFDGLGLYLNTGTLQVDASASSERATVQTSSRFWLKGTYFPALRAYSQRPFQNDTAAKWAKVHNLGRVRVVVA